MKILILYFTLFISLISCKGGDFSLSAPKATTSGGSNVNFNHANFYKSSCVQCHESKRPITTPPHGNGGDCISCHTAVPNSFGVRSWVNVTNFSHSPAPTSCMNCHENKRPLTKEPHMNNQWGAKEDCLSCHSFPSWKPAKFDHAKQLSSCIECHRSATKDDRPLPKTSHPADFYNQIDCIQCHTNSTNNKKWTDVIFNHKTHSPAPTSCMNCHEIKRPLSHTVNPRVSGMDKGDCKSCHTNTSDWKQSVAFNHETAKPTSCIGCHATSIPANQPSHPSPVGNYSKIDCIQCHTYDQTTSARSWKKLVFNHFTHSPTPTSCLECHKNINDSRPKTNTHLTGSRSTKDCATCHKYDGVLLWTNFSNFNHIATDATERCDSCHNSTNKSLTAKPTNHIATTMDCKSCHTSNAWKPASYTHAPTDTNCISCHNGTNASARPTTHTLTFSNQQCSTCHNQTAFTPKVFNTAYKHSSAGGMPPKGTSYHKSQSTCTKCHSTTTDSVIYNDTVANSKLMPRCAGCHTSDYVPSKHGNKTISTNANCLQCHSYNGW